MRAMAKAALTIVAATLGIGGGTRQINVLLLTLGVRTMVVMGNRWIDAAVCVKQGIQFLTEPRHQEEGGEQELTQGFRLHAD